MSTFFGYSAEIDMGGNSITGLKSTEDGDPNDVAVSKDYVDKIDERVVNKAGFLRTDIDMGARLINRDTVPVLDSELVNKKYVDTKFKQILLLRSWSYNDLRGTTIWPRSSTKLWPSFPMIVSNLTENAYISIFTLLSDDDGGGLDVSDTLEVYIRYVTHDDTNTQITHEKLIFTANLSNYIKYNINDGQGLIHCFNINHDYYLNQLTDYKNIKLFYVGLKQIKGTNHGNECGLIVRYTDPK